MTSNSLLIKVSHDGGFESASLQWESIHNDPDVIQQDIMSPTDFGGLWVSIRFPENWSADFHDDPLYDEYINITEGFLTLVLESDEIRLRAGDSTVIPRATRHGWRTENTEAALLAFAVPKSQTPH